MEETTTSEDSSSDHGAGDSEEAAMAITPVANDAPPVSATTQPSDPSPVEEETPLMEVDEGNDGPPLASPVSPREDEMSTGGGAAGVEGEMANLKVSSPKGQEGSDEDASHLGGPSSLVQMPTCGRRSPASASRMPMKKGQEPRPWNVEEDGA